MARLSCIVFGILILQMYVLAAPSDVSKLEDIAKVEQAEPKLDSVPADDLKLDTELVNDPKLDSELENDPKIDSVQENDPKLVSVSANDPKLDSNSKDLKVDHSADSVTETQRQKRWYNPFGYGFPPMSPLIYSGFNKRDEGANTDFFGGEDPFAQIHRRIQEIADIVRQPPPPPPPHFPIYFPVLFVPPNSDCHCDPNFTTQPESPTTTDLNTSTLPSITNRWPELDDERQNWGFSMNKSNSDEDGGEEYSRPISFDPIRVNKPVRPPPPVEHGTVQSSSGDNQGQTQFEAPSTRPPPPPQNASPAFGSPQNFSPPQRRPQGLAPPSRCDGAVLTCCHQSPVTYDCFATQGCSDLTAYGNPCNAKLILTVVQRFQQFYEQRRAG